MRRLLIYNVMNSGKKVKWNRSCAGGNYSPVIFRPKQITGVIGVTPYQAFIPIECLGGHLIPLLFRRT